ncbi:MAG: twin transmembrane helix small protein [Betaproteobacteria bacterium]|nr:twin transmembrane helix small protein [Betaproteobacteria bacterium]MBU6511126.1 twin transmembrane helix small protein [Betaproteobacteria bacterium]MDE1955162.1 twin transmembrane helix small protein [Betaproteobacteria bacterium]MDE2150829.1 twin transmembrane helix small protein [Betaproteobacteria bacterium]MDE2479141.1 twin transmembrane helix small protein [Betaproteobacteria bacterium]
MRIVVLIAFVLILGSLFSGLYFVMKDKGKSNRAVNALTFRIGFSILLFLFILLSYRMGWIHPGGMPLTSR